MDNFAASPAFFIIIAIIVAAGVALSLVLVSKARKSVTHLGGVSLWRLPMTARIS